MTKIEKLAKKLNEDFRDILAAEFAEEFDVELESWWNIVKNRMISSRKDGKAFTRKQLDYIQAFESGFTRAMTIVRQTK